jgi:hypothetical protein
MVVIGLTGSRGREFARRCDHALVTPSPETPRIQEGHIAMGHAWCALIEDAMRAVPRPGVASSVLRRAGAGRSRAASRRRASRKGRR